MGAGGCDGGGRGQRVRAQHGPGYGVGARQGAALPGQDVRGVVEGLHGVASPAGAPGERRRGRASAPQREGGAVLRHSGGGRHRPSVHMDGPR